MSFYILHVSSFYNDIYLNTNLISAATQIYTAGQQSMHLVVMNLLLLQY
jgi:hypothetical protein